MSTFKYWISMYLNMQTVQKSPFSSDRQNSQPHHFMKRGTARRKFVIFNVLLLSGGTTGCLLCLSSILPMAITCQLLIKKSNLLMPIFRPLDTILVCVTRTNKYKVNGIIIIKIIKGIKLNSWWYHFCLLSKYFLVICTNRKI